MNRGGNPPSDLNAAIEAAATAALKYNQASSSQSQNKTPSQLLHPTNYHLKQTSAPSVTPATSGMSVRLPLQSNNKNSQGLGLENTTDFGSGNLLLGDDESDLFGDTEPSFMTQFDLNDLNIDQVSMMQDDDVNSIATSLTASPPPIHTLSESFGASIGMMSRSMPASVHASRSGNALRPQSTMAPSQPTLTTPMVLPRPSNSQSPYQLPSASNRSQRPISIRRSTSGSNMMVPGAAGTPPKYNIPLAPAPTSSGSAPYAMSLPAHMSRQNNWLGSGPSATSAFPLPLSMTEEGTLAVPPSIAFDGNGELEPASLGTDRLSRATLEYLTLEKRRKRRESHNAVERRRRDNINDRILELSTLLPPDVGTGSGNGSPQTASMELPSASAPPTSNSSQLSAQLAAAAEKQNKGQILRKSADYIRFLQELVQRQNARLQSLDPHFKPHQLQTEVAHALFGSGSGSGLNTAVQNSRRTSASNMPDNASSNDQNDMMMSDE